jgi:hypothetical protein
MAVTLTAPITETDFIQFPSLKIPQGMSGDPMTLLLNKAWATLTTYCHQPLNQTTSTEVKEFPSRFCNVRFDGTLIVIPKNMPLISVTSISWSASPSLYGWTALTGYDVLADPCSHNASVIVQSSPFERGDTGFIQFVYSSGYVAIPDDLKLCCALMTSHLLSGGYFPTEGTSGEGSILPGWLPQDVDKILTAGAYKRVV